jgi:hypothetical protein
MEARGSHEIDVNDRRYGLRNKRSRPRCSPGLCCCATADGQWDVERPDANDASANGAEQPDVGRHYAHDAGQDAFGAVQDAFGAVQEIVRILEADPKTDWSKVNLEALRQHLIDMNEVRLKADAVTRPIEGGIEVTVTGTGRTVEAMQRMVPAQAHQVDQTHLNGWSAKTELLPNGVLLTVTSGDPQQVQHIRGLGFIGFMASGSHHQAHHYPWPGASSFTRNEPQQAKAHEGWNTDGG